ncbi:MAG: EAL domain-containing protein [Pseudomonadota bacterium]
MARRMADFWRDLPDITWPNKYRPLLLAILPAVSLGLFWTFGESALLALAISVPIFVLILEMGQRLRQGSGAKQASGLTDRAIFDHQLRETFEACFDSPLKSVLFRIEVDEHEALVNRLGQSAVDDIIAQSGARIASSVRSDDMVTRLGDFSFGVCLSPVRLLNLEECIQVAGRLQQALEEPLSIDGTTAFITASIGFCQSSHAAGKSAKDWVNGASAAVREAQFNGPAAIRAFSDEMRRRSEVLSELRHEVAAALEAGQIQPWYQPQISTDTGLVTGFEALARWHHPMRGMIPPDEFLPSIEQAGLLERLAEVMMFHAFTALKGWDAGGVLVPQVGVNFAGPELHNPSLVEKVKWQLDRFELAPERLAIEVLETVVSQAPDDVVSRNIKKLGAMGCRIDLDDFGTGHASITSIQRFAVSRIKIDRSFVMKSDRDPEQQRMIGAILTMADRLDVETLAEGVETAGEHALLAQLGCNHVQGYGIAKPMPFDQTFDWIAAHNSKLRQTPRIIGNRSR